MLIEAFTRICDVKMTFLEFKRFKFTFWIKNIDYLVLFSIDIILIVLENLP